MDMHGPLPTPTPLTAPFWQSLAAHQVTLQQCDDCGAWVFYPRSNCSHCLSASLSWREVSGHGTIYSYTIARRPTAPQFNGLEPQQIAVVELAEGVRMNTVIVNADAAQLRVGLPVRPVFYAADDERTLLFFEPDV